MKRVVLLVALFGLGLAGAGLLARPGIGSSADGTLTANVGPGFTISLTQNGTKVTHLADGTYTIDVTDSSSIHNFDLLGPDGSTIDATDVAGTGSTTWTVTLADGVYHYQCDVHAATMHGDFSVGTATLPTTTTTSTPPLTAHIGTARATATRVRAAVSANRAGTGTLGLYRRTTRLAHRTGRVGPTPHIWILRPPRPLAAGRYTLKLRVVSGSSAARASKAVRVP